MCLLAEVPLAGVLLCGVLLVAKEDMVLVVFGLLEKREKIPPGSVTLEEERVLLFFDASPRFWYSWSLSSLVDWTGGHWHLCFWSLSMRRYADTTMQIREYKCNRYKNEIGMDERV